MLTRTAEALLPEAEAIAARLKRHAGLEVEVRPEKSQPGSGSAPGVFLATHVVAVRSRHHSADDLALALRRNDPPVFARIQDGQVLLDPRTLLPGDEAALLAAFEGVVAASNEDEGSFRPVGRPRSP
jgi:L-seryl-tRNA(Ser) seleniumtransferase